MDFKDSQEKIKKASTPEGPEVGQTFGASSKETGDIQTVRASLFENVVERRSVLMVDESKAGNKVKHPLSSPSFKRGSSEDEGTLVTATYKEPMSPSSPLRVVHAFDTVQAVEENRAVSENVPSAQWEDKAMTLRTRRSEGSRSIPERTVEPASAVTPEQQPRYLRVGALQKWTAAGLEQEASVDKGMLKEAGRDMALDKDRQREAEQEEMAAAPKRLKMLQGEEQAKPRATYFALTGQMQEPPSPVDGGASIGDFIPGSSQGKVLPVRRNTSLEGKSSQDLVEELMKKSHMSHEEIRSQGPMNEEMMEVEKKRVLKKEKAKLKELEKEKQRQLEMEREDLEFERLKEREMQREFERQRQKAFEKEKQEFEEKQRALERQKQIELEKQKLQELEREKLERERQQRQLEKEKRRELERQRKIEKEKQREQERERQREQERQRQREEERQRELDKERQLLEIQKEKQRMAELERMKELERQQLQEFQKQKQKEKERQQILELEKQRLREKKEREEADKMRQIALEQEMLRIKELEKERERQREMEKERQKEIERERQKELERQRQLDLEKQELENQRLRQRELEKEKQRKEEIERVKEMERLQLLEFEKQKQAERERQQVLEMEKRRLKQKMEREEAERMRQIAKQQEAERQRLKEKQKKEEQERARLESTPLRPKGVDVDSVLRSDPFPKAAPQRSDLSTRWKEPSLRVEEPYKPAILDLDFFTSQAPLSPSKDLFPVPGVQSVDTGLLQPERDISWKVPTQTSVGFTSPVWTTSPQDPWELRPVEMSVDQPVAEPRKQSVKLSPEQVLLRQEERVVAPQRPRSAGFDEMLHLVPFPGIDSEESAGGEQIWLPREPHPPDSRAEVQSHRRSQGSQVSQTLFLPFSFFV